MHQTCDPLTARWWFKHTNKIKYASTTAVFIILFFLILQFQICDGLPAFAIALVLAFGVFFYFQERVIGIVCPNSKCGKYIETNTPWNCGNPKCHKDNEQVDDFPFVNRCQHCGVEQKAYKCHHCGYIIYLSKDQLKTICATCVELPVTIKSKSARKDPVAVKIARENEAIRKTEYDLRKAKLDLELKGVKEYLDPKKEMTQEEILSKSAKEFTDRNMSGPRIVARMKAENAETFKNNPVELNKANLAVDKWASDHLELF